MAKTIDELIIFFIAGNDTIKTLIGNTVCYLAQHPEAKAKLMAEITPVLDAASDNFLNKLDSDAVDQFEFVR